jgi:hypothetical protein
VILIYSGFHGVVRPGHLIARRTLKLRIAEFGALLVVGTFLIWATRGYTFLQDEWDFIQYREGWDANAFLVPHNQHLLATDVLIYKLLFATVGIGDFLPYRLTGVAIHLISVALLFEVARRRVGNALGAAVALPVALLGTGWFVVLNPFNMQWSLSLAAMLGIVLLLDGEDRRYDPVISLLLLVALASSSLGVPIAVGVAARLALEGGGLRRAWVVALPLTLYGAWFLHYGLHADRAPDASLTVSPAFLFHLAAGALAALAGVPLADGGVPHRDLVADIIHLLALVTLAIVATAAARTRSGRVALPLCTLVVFWVVVTLSRGYQHAPYSTQYVFVGAVLLLLVALELAGNLEIPRWVAHVAAAAFCLSAALNASVLGHHADLRRHDAAIVRGEIGALILARDTAPENFRPDSDPIRAPSVIAGTLFHAIAKVGSPPGAGVAEIERAPESVKVAADRVLVAAGAVEVITVPRPRRRACSTLRPGREGADLDLAPGAAVMVLPPERRETRLTWRRFASGIDNEPAIDLTGPSLIAAHSDGAKRHWHARLVSSGSIATCVPGRR